MKGKELMQDIKLLQASDWDIKEETREYVLMEKNKASLLGHIVIFLLFWWTFGVANLVYWLVSKKTKKVMK